MEEIIHPPFMSCFRTSDFQNHGERAQRNPKILTATDGRFLPWLAERKSLLGLSQEPPRSARIVSWLQGDIVYLLFTTLVRDLMAMFSVGLTLLSDDFACTNNCTTSLKQSLSEIRLEISQYSYFMSNATYQKAVYSNWINPYPRGVENFAEKCNNIGIVTLLNR